jgi:hypothetical protein
MNKLPDFKKAFETAKATGNTVMEGGEMEDFFQMSVMEIHSTLESFTEFSICCAKAGDMVGLEEVVMHIKGLADLTQAMYTKVKKLDQNMFALHAAEKEVTAKKAEVEKAARSFAFLLEENLGSEFDTE